MKNCILILAILVFPRAYSQDSIVFPGKLIVNGYVKDLQSITFDKDLKVPTSLNIIHNRINLKWKLLNNTTVVTELRNRIFWGEEVKLTPGFTSMLRNQNEMLDFQKAWISDSSFIAHTNAERLYFDYNSDKINVRIGRQRINWGVTTTWNPNDIFNTYNFLDFDYEERPGSDGAKVQYRFNATSNIELAYANTGGSNENIAVTKLSLNKWNYDLQIISGWYRDHITVGAGWAGSIKDAGFKGEVQYFAGNQSSGRCLNFALEGDYMFKKGLYLNTGFLFNSKGLAKPGFNWEDVDLRTSPQQLMPTKWNIIIAATKEINPLFSATTSLLYAPGTNLLIILPSLQYSMMENLDISMFWQSFFVEINDRFRGISHRCFLRMKWSF